MRVVVVDNYDSFTFNLVQALRVLDAEVIVVRNDEKTVAEICAMEPHRIVISPGPSTPERAGISVELVKRLAGRVPILGVCLGHQAIAVAFGGRVVRAARPMHGKTSIIWHDGLGVLADCPSPLEATRYHSLIVAEDCLPGCLEVTARSEEGELMGLRLRGERLPGATGDAVVEGVQFHPESYLTPHGSRLLATFLDVHELEIAK